MIITICGTPGSGKSTVARALAKKLGYNFYSMGDLRGKMAMDRGLTIDELNDIGTKESWTDTDADTYQKTLGEKEDNFVMDSWLGFHFIPHAFKILLKTSLDEAAKRIFKDPRPDEKKTENEEELKQLIKNRVENTTARYKKYYAIENIYDETHYDFVIDTTLINPDQVVEQILEKVKNLRNV